MISKRTVLVLGAGSSVNYGFMLGERLKFCVAEQAREILKAKRLSNISRKDLKVFERTVTLNRRKTIDQFLGDHPRFRAMGARIVAKVISAHESEDQLLSKNYDWYTHFYDELRFDGKSPDLSGLSIVTFNYDRSLEHYMAERIPIDCPEPLQRAARRMWNKVTIVHAHGSIGQYPKVKYGKADPMKSRVKVMMISDKVHVSRAFRQAQGLIADADRVVFIGFGYNKKTVDLLFQNCEMHEKQIFGTCFEMTQDERNEAMKLFNEDIIFAAPSLNAAGFMEALSKGEPDRPLLSGLDRMVYGRAAEVFPPIPPTISLKGQEPKSPVAEPAAVT